jgi:hypothetical protein
MKPNPVHRLPAPLEPAVQTLKLAARHAVERTIESLGLAALAAGNAYQRDGLLGAQFELNRKSAVFVLSFNDAFDERVMREAGGNPAATAAKPAATAWDALSLVADHEVEVQISAERFGMDVAHACEWELREFDAYVATLLDYQGNEKDRNPLRPQVVGHAMLRAIESVSERAEVRKLLSSEISRSLGGLLRKAYADIVAELRRAGVQPRGLSVRTHAPPRGSESSGYDTSSRAAALDDPRGGYSRSGASVSGPFNPAYRQDPGHDPITGVRRSYGPTGHTGHGGFAASSRGSMGGRGPSLGAIDPGLMNLIRRLSVSSGGHLNDGPGPAGHGLHRNGAADGFGASAGWTDGQDFDDGPAVPNLILAHRDELRQASKGSLDHMVIDVIAGLFDQILSDPKVPPQMARQIARLQLPVLRAALGDTSFFSSRRHPVRRFINRIASLGAAFEDYSDPVAQRFLAKIKALVQQVVEGDFDQVEIYESQLRALEVFMAEIGQAQDQAAVQAAELLAQKEDEQRLRQLYAQRLEGELKGLAGPEFVRDFITRTWSQVMIRAASQDGADSPLAQRLRRAGRELFMSVQPKATPQARKAFLADLPRLMRDLTEGMDLIRWPEAERRAFFGQLMPAHAEALKNTSARLLDINLLARQVEGAIEQALPSADELRAAPAALPVLDDEVQTTAFTPEEARRVGLVQETAVNWAAPASPHVDIELDAPAAGAGAAAEPLLPGAPLPAEPAEAPEPTQGRALADHVQVGFAYQMELEGQWQKVRLSHVSPARSFFVFTHGSTHAQKTVSLSRRMLEKLCEAGRLRAFEQALLVERATARARRQLARLGA